ncbi:MAG TPA: hypothetical protein VLL76_06425 [Candidatus Omnitrophota bacterium]|nr:hypothetical protein [Candidatus Omnitrophota bacterium]
MKRLMLVLLAALAGWSFEAAAEPLLKPFVLASRGSEDPAAVAAAVTAKLKAANFTVVGSYSPYPAATVIAVTDDRLRAEAAKSRFGGYGAVQRVAVTRVRDETQVSYTNPLYFAQAYRMASDLAPVAGRLEQALGRLQEFGPKDGLPAEELRSYRYMFGMERFSDPNLLAEHASYKDAVAAVESGLAAGTKGVSKVYRVDLPGKDETVFGVALKGSGGNEQQDDAFIMNEIDFKELRSTAHLPYEMLVSGNKVYALSARFRIAIDFPDLSMMGSNSFMNIMGSPDAIRTALSHAAGGDWTVLKAQ